MTAPEEHNRLEPWIDQVLSEQPLRRAPATLEGRVMRDVARHRWWRQSFTYWPVPARALFLLASYGFVCLTLWVMAALRAAAGPTAATAMLSPTVARVLTELGVTGSVIKDLWLALQSIPPHWLEGALALGAMLYVALFALIAIAYRTLYINE